MHDIAKHLGVSIATVSLMLNGKAKEYRISDALAARMLAYVEEVGYKPNQLAKSLRTGKTHVIGLIIEDISNPFLPPWPGLSSGPPPGLRPRHARAGPAAHSAAHSAGI